MKLKNPQKYHTKIDSFTTLVEKNFPIFSFVCQIVSKRPNFISLDSSQTLYFPLKNTTSLMFTTEKMKNYSVVYLILIS